MTSTEQLDIVADIAAISQIEAVTTILDVVCRTTGMGFSAVARVTDTRWIACAVRDEIGFGLTPGGELELQTTICDEIRQSGKYVAIDHVMHDALFVNHHTPKQYGFESYISMPIVLKDGRFFGTLCAIDPRPARVTSPEIVGMFRMFSDLIAFHLDALDRLAQGEQALRIERADAELREQFIAVLGHDLRNPLASIDAGASALSEMTLDANVAPVAGLIRRSAARMTGLISDVLDFARGRLGGGISVTRVANVQLLDTLRHVVNELQVAYPTRVIQSHFAISHAATVDGDRIAQLFSNLLANALVHGDAKHPVTVRAFSNEKEFELSVANRGDAIAPETMQRLFQPFTRATVRGGQQGLGLGLYIASEIARAHNGSLTADSSERETRFTFSMAP